MRKAQWQHWALALLTSQAPPGASCNQLHAASPGASRARSGAFDVIVAEALDRLSRDLANVALLYKHLSYLGVRLVIVAEGEINELHVGLKGTMNALYMKDLAQKTHCGLEGAGPRRNVGRRALLRI